MTMREILNQNSRIEDYITNSRTSDYDWDFDRRFNWNEHRVNDHCTDYGWDVENKLNNYFSLVEALMDRVGALEELCKNFKKVLDIKTDKDLMKFLEDFGFEREGAHEK